MLSLYMYVGQRRESVRYIFKTFERENHLPDGSGMIHVHVCDQDVLNREYFRTCCRCMHLEHLLCYMTTSITGVCIVGFR